MVVGIGESSAGQVKVGHVYPSAKGASALLPTTLAGVCSAPSAPKFYNVIDMFLWSAHAAFLLALSRAAAAYLSRCFQYRARANARMRSMFCW